MERIKRNYALVIMGLTLGGIALNSIIDANGYKFEPVSYLLFTIAYCVIVGAIIVGCIKFYKKAGVASRLCGAFMPIGAIFHWVSIIVSMDISGAYEVIFLLAETILGMSFFYFHVKNELLRTVVIVLAGSFIGVLCFVLSLASVFSNFGVVYNSEAVFSPNKQYYAFVKTHDEGALGGSTQVVVRECGKDVSIGIGTLKKKHHTLEYGNWGKEYTLRWESEEKLQINGTEYYVPKYMS